MLPFPLCPPGWNWKTFSSFFNSPPAPRLPPLVWVLVFTSLATGSSWAFWALSPQDSRMFLAGTREGPASPGLSPCSFTLSTFWAGFGKWPARIHHCPGPLSFRFWNGTVEGMGELGCQSNPVHVWLSLASAVGCCCPDYLLPEHLSL